MYRMIAAICLLAVCGCSGSPPSSVVEKRPFGIIEMTADFMEKEGIKTVSTETGPHRSIEYILFSIISPAQFEGRKILISVDKPHLLPTTRGGSIHFRVDADRIPKDAPEKSIRLTLHDIELVSQEKDAQQGIARGSPGHSAFEHSGETEH